MKTVKIATLAVCMIITLMGCDELPLMRNYDFDEDPDGARFQTLLEHFESSYNQNALMYCQAIRMTGLQEQIETAGMMCIIPNNDAFTSLLASMGVESLEEVEPAILRSLLLYLIFPGDFRAVTMVPDSNYRNESLAGPPIFIKRSPTTANKYRVVINDRPEELAAGSMVTVSQQDYVFKDRVVAQIVPEFILYKPIVPVTDMIPEGFFSEDAVKATLTVIDDCSVYQGSTSSVYNNVANGVQLCARSSSSVVRNGCFKFPLDPVPFQDEIVSATLITRVLNVAGYSIGEVCTVRFRELPFSDWTETDATWRTIRGTFSNPIARCPVIINSSDFTVISRTVDDWIDNPVELRTDITSSILSYYMNDSTHICLLAEDFSGNRTTASSIINLFDKDYRKYYSTIELTGPFPSEMVFLMNSPVVVSDGSATLTPDDHFAMAAPATVPEGYSYADQNIIYSVKTVPANGALTVYGIPTNVNSRFTQAEMRAGVVKYVRTKGASDSFVLKVYDYLGGLYPDDLTITVQ